MSQGVMGAIARGLLGKLVAGALGLVLLGGAYFLFFKSEQAAAAKVGDCVEVTGSSMNADSHTVPCDDERAAYVVMAKGKSCDEVEVSFEVTVGKGNGTTAVASCLAYNLEKGECISIGTGMSPATKPACRAAEYKALLVADDTDDDASCPKKTTLALANKTRGTLICLGDA